jgi:hypothetical protein
MILMKLQRRVQLLHYLHSLKLRVMLLHTERKKEQLQQMLTMILNIREILPYLLHENSQAQYYLFQNQAPYILCSLSPSLKV